MSAKKPRKAKGSALPDIETERTLAMGRPGQGELDELIAPPPTNDRFPIVIGGNLTLQYLTAVYRICTTGLRWQFVDLLDELVEHDPHARGVLRQRVLAVAGARLEVHVAKLPKDHAQSALAREIRDEVDRQFSQIEGFTQSLGALSWASLYGLTGAETIWKRGSKWEVKRLHLLHSRRLNYPTVDCQDVHVWDQGNPQQTGGAYRPGQQVFGIRCKDYPAKFVIHAPQLSGDYPSRDGEGRYIGTYMCLKRMIVRALSQDFERTIRPWVVGFFNREEDGSKRTVATKQDIAILKQVVNALGTGSMNSGTLADACKVEILKAESKYDPLKFLEFLNSEISKGVLGQTFTTESQKNGNRNTADTAKSGTLELTRYDARCLCDTLERDLVRYIVSLNYGEENLHLAPRLSLNVEEEVSPDGLMDLAVKGTSIDMPIDLDDLAERTGIKITAVDDKLARRTRMVDAGRVPEPQNDDPNEPGSQTPPTSHGDEPPPEGGGAPPANDKTNDAPEGAVN